MIVRRLMLKPFAGGADREIDFANGLTVVLGHNEAGKSTIASALRSVLFAHGPMNLNRFKMEIQPFLPVGLGDTARVRLEFTGAGRLYRVERTWAAPKSVTSRLWFDNGSELADETEIQRIIEESLGFARGTFDNVMCLSQAHLSRTIERLRGDADGSAGGFADALRRSLYASDGVPVDHLKAQVEKQVSEYFSRWDRAVNGPEKGRGLDDRWEKGAGIIVNAWYDYQEAERLFREAATYETAVDEFVAKERRLREQRDGFQRTVADFTPLVADVRRRADIDARLRESEREITEITTVLAEWPLAKARMDAASDAIAQLLSQHKELEAELRSAQEQVRQETLRSKFANADALHRRMGEEEQRLAGLPAITEAQLSALRNESVALQKLDIRIAAKKLAVRFAAKKSMDLRIQGEPHHLEPGENYSGVVPGKLSLAHQDWNLDVWSSEEDAESLERQHAESRKRLESSLQQLGAKTFDEAAATRRSVADQEARVKEARAALSAVLGEESYESLQQQYQALPLPTPGRTEAAIRTEMEKIREQGADKRADQKYLKEKCDAWAGRFGTQEKLLSDFAVKSGAVQKLKEDLQQCRPLPQGFREPEAFLSAFDAAQIGLRDAERALSDTEKSRLDFEKRAPRQSREEYQEELETCKREYERALRYGAAYRRVKDELQSILQSLEQDIFEPYHKRVRELLDVLTNHRHTSVVMSGPLPERLGSSDRQLALTQLSVGTLDVLALAVRIAMAEAHLRPDDGFMVLDDPMVNLDPVRQSATASCLQELSRRHQVIVFTCHPTHAEMLGGDRVSLDKSPASSVGSD